MIATAALPVAELRVSIPLAHSLGMSVAKAYSLSVAGNTLPIPLVLIALWRYDRQLRKLPVIGKILDWCMRRAMRRQRTLIDTVHWRSPCSWPFHCLRPSVDGRCSCLCLQDRVPICPAGYHGGRLARGLDRDRADSGGLCYSALRFSWISPLTIEPRGLATRCRFLATNHPVSQPFLHCSSKRSMILQSKGIISNFPEGNLLISPNQRLQQIEKIG